MNLLRRSISHIAVFALVTVVGCGDVNIVVGDAAVGASDAGGERSDNRCGPAYENARCGTNRCCSSSNYCGNLNEPHCTTNRGYNGMFDGPRAVERSDNRCGPAYENARCGTNRCCSSSNYCGNLNEPHCTSNRGYNGMFDGPRM